MEMSQQIPKLLFVGAGNIAQSIIKGIIRAQPDAAKQILATAPSTKNLDIIKNSFGCQVSLMDTAVKTMTDFKPDIVLLCIKPQVFLAKNKLLADLLLKIPPSCIALSLIAGIKTNDLVGSFNLSYGNVVRAMLSTAAEVGSTSVFYHPFQALSPPAPDFSRLEDVFRLIGSPVIKLNDENLMDVATGICGSGIALFYEAIQTIIDVAVLNGLGRADAIRMAAQLSKAAGEMLLTREAHTYQLRDDMLKPAGTTTHGIQKWHEQSTSQKIALAIQASINRSKELSSLTRLPEKKEKR